MNDTNQKISFSYDDLSYMLQLARDRKFKIEIKDLKYSKNFIEKEEKGLTNLCEKLEIVVQQFRDRMYLKKEKKENE